MNNLQTTLSESQITWLENKHPSIQIMRQWPTHQAKSRGSLPDSQSLMMFFGPVQTSEPKKESFVSKLLSRFRG